MNRTLRAPRTLALASALLAAGCLTPEEYREQADRDVYALIDSRRDELFSEPAGFNIEPAQDSLRQRILSGEWQGSAPLTLLQCLDIAAENNREYQTRKEDLYRTALDLTLERWRFETQGFGVATGAAVSTGPNADRAAVSAETGLERTLGTGAQVVTAIGVDLFRLIATDDSWHEISSVRLAFTQPLMRGFGELVVKEPLTQAEHDLVYAVRSFERFRRTFGVDVAQRVYDLLQAIDTLANEEQNYANLVALRVRNEALTEAGRLSDIEADQARQEELVSENRLIALRGNLDNQTDEFLLFLGLPVGTPLQLDPEEFSRLTDVDELLDRLDQAAALDFALSARLDYLNTLDMLEDRRRQVAVAEDALRAGLELSGGAAIRSREDRPESLRNDGLAWDLSLSLDLPIERVAERNAYRRTIIDLEEARRDVEQQGDTITADVRDAIRRAQNTRASYLIQRGAAVLAARRVESASLNLEAGRASTRDVLDAQEDLVAAQNAETFALIEFTLARLDLYLQLEVLRVDESGLHLDEALIPRLIADGDE